eukprot:15033276-Alexandrium_andersonii.AAC.1
MSASLVGSEMCIRDSPCAVQGRLPACKLSPKRTYRSTPPAFVLSAGCPVALSTCYCIPVHMRARNG